MRNHIEIIVSLGEIYLCFHTMVQCCLQLEL